MFRYWGHVLYILNINFEDSLRSSSHQIWENITYLLHYVFLHKVYEIFMFCLILCWLLLSLSLSLSSLRKLVPDFSEKRGKVLFSVWVSSFHHDVPKRRTQITHWRGTIFQNNGDFICTSAILKCASSVFSTVRLQSILTHSMVQSPSWEANWFAASQEITRISRNPKVHYRTHKRPPSVCILGRPNPVHIPTSHFLEIRSNIIRPSMPKSPQWSPSLRFPHQDLVHPPLLTHTHHMPSPSHSSRFVTRTILGEEYKSFSSSLCNLLHFPVTSSLLGPNILLNTLFSNTLSFLSSRSVNDQFHTHTKQQAKL